MMNPKEVVEKASYLEVWEEVFPEKTGIVFIKENEEWSYYRVEEGKEVERGKVDNGKS